MDPETRRVVSTDGKLIGDMVFARALIPERDDGLRQKIRIVFNPFRATNKMFSIARPKLLGRFPMRNFVDGLCRVRKVTRI